MTGLDEINSLRKTNRTGEKLSLDESVDAVIHEMTFSLDELKNGEWNGMPIKPERIPGVLAITLDPVLEMSRGIVNLVSDEAKGWRTLSVQFQDRAKTGQTEINTNALGKKLENAINTWLGTIDAFENDGIIDSGATGKPLAINDQARDSAQLLRLSDVFSQTGKGGWSTKPFVSDIDASAKMAANPAPARTRAPA